MKGLKREVTQTEICERWMRHVLGPSASDDKVKEAAEKFWDQSSDGELREVEIKLQECGLL